MKKTLFSLLAIFVISSTNAQNQTSEELKLQTTLYYDLNEVFASIDELLKLEDVIKLLVSDPTFKVQIAGYCDHVGSDEVNDRMSYARAKSTAEYMMRRNVAKDQISFVGYGVDTSAKSDALARRVDVSQIITVVIEPTPKPKPDTKPKNSEKRTQSQPVVATPEETISEPTSVVATTTTDGFSLRTNLLYWLVGNINLGVEYKRNSFGYLVNGGYSPFEKTEWSRNLGSWFIAPEIRYYLGEKDAWFVGGQFLAGGYNYKLSDTGYKGSMIGGGVTGGYKLTLNDNLDMDFSLGLGYGALNYDSYYKHDNGTNVYIDKDITKNTFMPIQLGVSLIFKL